MNIIFSSCGNDSVALIQWAINNGLSDLNVAYSDTKWSSDDWPDRVDAVKDWVESNGGKFHFIESIGFSELAKQKKAFPANGMAFCSYELKIKPAMEWLDLVDPEKAAVCYVGIMRLESKERSQWPEVTESSPNHGGRKLVAPLSKFSIEQRNDLLAQSGFEILETRSKECFPCVNATIKDLQELGESDVQKVHELEVFLGRSKRTGKAKYMFRSKRMGGAKGIHQVKERADRGGGSYSPLQGDLYGCDSGFCGS